MKTGIVILAAGNSSRLGEPKQLLHFKGKSLLNIVCEEALKTSFRPIVVVLGAYADQIPRENGNEINYKFNAEWEKGMASSISAGLTNLIGIDETIENVIITVADQVFITANIFENLVTEQKRSGKGIVAATYAKTTGTPVLFHKKYFEKLLSLEGNAGAKKIVQHHLEDTSTVSFEKGAIDIDTQEDYEKLINSL